MVTAGFFALVSLGAWVLLGQWLVASFAAPGARVDIAEWPFVIVGLVIALLPLAAAASLAMGRALGVRLGRASAYLILAAGGMALLVALAQLSIGIAWTLLLAGIALLVGALLALRSLSATVAERR